jgi:hypothetical protein
LICAAELLKLNAEGKGKGGGTAISTLVFISSDSGSTGRFNAHEDGFGAYAASKAALNQGLRVRKSLLLPFFRNFLEKHV